MLAHTDAGVRHLTAVSLWVTRIQSHNQCAQTRRRFCSMLWQNTGMDSSPVQVDQQLYDCFLSQEILSTGISQCATAAFVSLHHRSATSVWVAGQTLTCHVGPLGCADELSVHHKLRCSSMQVGAGVQVHKPLPAACLIPHRPPLAAAVFPFAHLLLSSDSASHLHDSTCC